jgi:hypothetical protein
MLNRILPNATDGKSKIQSGETNRDGGETNRDGGEPSVEESMTDGLY